MAEQASRMIFVNLPVRDLDASKDFFTKLGFTFNPMFTDENAAAMIINDQATVMLLTEKYFKGFMKNEICNTGTHTEALLAVSCSSREHVDEQVKTALANGGRPAMDAKDHGFMYQSSFYDRDGHHWEVMWMDPAAMQG